MDWRRIPSLVRSSLTSEFGRTIFKGISRCLFPDYLNQYNATRCSNSPRFKVRHGICYEQDALLIKIGHIDHNSLDLIGRAVVLAFRLSGMQADFPGIATQKELINGKPRPIGYSWKKKRLTREDNLKYFKGEKFGANNIYVSVGKIRKLRTTHSLTRSIKHAISKFEDKDAIAAG